MSAAMPSSKTTQERNQHQNTQPLLLSDAPRLTGGHTIPPCLLKVSAPEDNPQHTPLDTHGRKRASCYRLSFSHFSKKKRLETCEINVTLSMLNVTRTNTNLYVETGAAGAGASFPTGVCFLERDPSLHDYTIGFQCRGSKLQHQGIPSDCHHRLRSGSPLRDPRGKHATSFGFPQTGGAQGWRVEESERPRGAAALLCLDSEEK